MEYKLTKLSIKEGKFSGIVVGHSVIGKLYTKESMKSSTTAILDDVKVDIQILVYNNSYDFAQTSDILEILEKTENGVKFSTTTSIYELIEIEESV